LNQLYAFLFEFIVRLPHQTLTGPESEIVVLSQMLFEMGGSTTGNINAFAAECTRAFLIKTNQSVHAGNALRICDIVLFQLIMHLWPVSDRRHVVVTPALHSMGMALLQVNVTSMADLTRGLFLSSQIFNYIAPANRFATEPYLYYSSIVNLFCKQLETYTNAQEEKKVEKNEKKERKSKKDNNAKESKGEDKEESNYIKSSPLFHSSAILNCFKNEKLFCFENMKKLKKLSKSPLSFSSLSDDSPASDSALLSVLTTTLVSFERYVRLYTGPKGSGQGQWDIMDGSMGLLEASLRVIEKLALYGHLFPKEIESQISSFVAFLNESIASRKGKLRALQFLAKNHFALHKELTPDIHDYLGRNRKFTDLKNRDARDQKFLERKVKQERKGAEREIKLDAQFLARKKAEKRKEMDDERIQKTKRLMHDLGNQQHDDKLLQKLKKQKTGRG
jgi:hypothetical protein